jgi:hypothetical protein
LQEEPHEGNGDRREHRPLAEQPHGRAPMPPGRGPARDNNRRTNEGANIDANADADAPLLFRRASQNLTAAAMLLRGCLKAATSEERRVHQQLKALLEAAAAQQAESSASHHRSERERVERSPRTARIRLLTIIESAESEAKPRHRRLEAAPGPTATCGTPSRPDDGPRASTNTATTTRAITTIVDADGATTTTTTATAAGRRTKGVNRPLARAYATRSSLHSSVLRPTYLGTIGTPTPACARGLLARLPRCGVTDDLFIIKNLPLYLDESART